jgi:large subunit ribosomal protein L17
MRHLKAGRKLGRTSAHRKALFSNLVTALVTHGKIETTEAKAKELRSIADRTINWGVGVSDLVKRGPKKLSDIERARVVHAMRMARRVIKDEEALSRLFSEVGPAMAGRPGGYTRVLKTRYRIGDAAPMAIVQLTGSAGGGSGQAAAEAPAAPARGKKKAAKAEAQTEREPKKARKGEKPERSEKSEAAAKAKKGRGKKSDDE